ncbi:Hypothetical protein NTJ_16194 [Nesidiocoris tenuis]|uniref:Uncharacterized protein n=1 Tax=Nesidiocoris tenuis TaxID=355587 RepID=A0ABN7BG78_9HEMI|nr:Hypothetical protein NTJ_16194 [Nesidiocoris tenuis]
MGDHSIKFDRGSPGNVTIIGSVVTKPGSKWMYGNISGGRDPGPSGGTAPSVSRQLNWLPILSERVARRHNNANWLACYLLSLASVSVPNVIIGGHCGSGDRRN